MSRLIENRRGQIICYTDGSCLNNGSYNASAGFAVVFGINHAWNTWGPVEGRDTDNVAEIEAARNAVEIAGENKITSLLIRTDAQFMIDAYNKWIPKWISNGWCKSDGSEVRNRKEFEDLLRVIDYYDVDVELQHVQAHKNDTLNNEADRLAKRGAQGELADDETSYDETSDDETSDDETSDDETSDDETSDDETSDDY